MPGPFETSHLRGIFFREVDDDATGAAIEKAIKEGRPIASVETVYVERCRIKYAGDPKTETVFNAHEPFQYFRAPNQRQASWFTPADFFPEQYDLFSRGLAQVQDGVPIEEMPGVSAGKIQELKDLDIHTIEALASLEGSRLQRLGPNGRALMVKAKSHLEKLKGGGDTSALAEQVRDLQRQLLEFTGGKAPAGSAPAKPEDEQPPAHLKGAARTAWIRRKAETSTKARTKEAAKPDPVETRNAAAGGNVQSDARMLLEATDEQDLRNMIEAYGGTPSGKKKDLVEQMLEINAKAERGLKATQDA